MLDKLLIVLIFKLIHVGNLNVQIMDCVFSIKHLIILHVIVSMDTMVHHAKIVNIYFLFLIIINLYSVILNEYYYFLRIS